MFLRVHRQQAETIVAVCDAELLGRIHRRGEEVLDLEKHAPFYQGKKAGAEEVKLALSEATSANLVGKKAVAAAVAAGLAEKGAGRLVAGVPHLQVYKV